MRQFFTHGSIWLCLLLFGISANAQTEYVVNNQGFIFAPADLTIAVGDTVNWTIGSIHNVLEVSQATYNTNGNTALPGGFSTPFGGGKVGFSAPGTYYYVCDPHASLEMKGTITVTAATTTGETFVAFLSGNQEVPSVPSLASGMITATIVGDSLKVQGSFTGLSTDFNPSIGATGAHMHSAYAGSNGSIILNLTPTLNAGNRSGTFTEANNTLFLTPAQADLIRSRQVYVNMHTVGSPSGELRGQLAPSGKTYFFTNLLGSNEPTPVYTDGAGAMLFELSGDTLIASGSFRNLQGIFNGNPAGGSHIHNGITGTNGGIEFALTPTVDANQQGGVFTVLDNSITLTPAQITRLNERQLYANIHSTKYPGGEIRGQVHGMAQAIFRGFLAGANEVPSVSALGGGSILGELIGDSLVITGSFAGLGSDYNSGVGSHLHMAFAGANGPVVFPLSPALNVDNRGGTYQASANTLGLTPNQKEILLARMMYFNIHSVNIASGELRGQMLPEANYVFNAYLAGGQETRPVVSRGYGVLHGEVRGNGLTVTGSFAGLGSDYATNIGSHLHKGFFGQNGPVVLALTPMLGTDNRSATYMAGNNAFNLTSGLKDSLFKRALYANVHSIGNASGELRGQMLQEARAYFFAPVSGSSEVPSPLATPATGAAVIELFNNRGVLTGSFQNLQSDINLNIAGGSHIHGGLPGQAGPILTGVRPQVAAGNRSGTFLADSNIFSLSATRIDSLRDGFFYLNIHSVNAPSGEVRGTFLPQAQVYMTTTFGGINEVQPVVSTGNGALKLALNGSRITVAGSFQMLGGDFNPAIAGGSHLHRAGNGANGPLFRGLNVTLPNAADLKNGIYTARNNTFILSPGQLDSLLSKQVYYNVHSTTITSGELRGQLLPEHNFFPADVPVIQSPQNNTTATIEGPATTPFQATWSISTDEDPLAYVWQLSTAKDFSSFILNVNVGALAEFNSDFGTLATILANAGLNIGDSLKVFHRAIASDGALQTLGQADSIYLKLGTLTSIGKGLNEGLSVSVRPSRIADYTQLVIESERPANATIEVVSLQGKVLQQHQIGLIGGNQSYGLNLTSLSSGIYLIRVQVPGFVPSVTRVIKE